MLPARRVNLARQKSGRRVVMSLVGIFLAGQLLVGYLLDHHGASVRFPSALQLFGEAENGPRPNVLWLGSSRTAFSLRHDVVNRALWKQHGHHQMNFFNAGVPMGDPVAMEYVFNGLLARRHRPQVVILETSPEFLARNPLWLGEHAVRQLGWTETFEGVGESWQRSNVGRLVQARLLPLYVHRHQIRAQFIDAFRSTPVAMQRRNQEGQPYGPTYSDPPPIPGDLARSGYRISCDPGIYRWLFRNYEPDGVAARAFERILARCDREGIAVLLVAPPVAEDFRALYTPEFESRFQNYLATLRQRHSFVFHDLRDCIPDAGFGDMHHLNTQGSIVYSQLALQRVVFPGAEGVIQQARAKRSLSHR